MLPSYISAISKNEAPFSVAIMLLLDMLMLFFVYKIQMAGGIKMLKEKLPKPALIIIWLISISITVIITSLLLAGYSNFVVENLYNNINQLSVIVLGLILIIYMGLKGTETIGRLSEILIWFLPVTLFLSMFISRADMKPELLLPILWSNTGSVFKAAFIHVLWCLNYLPFLFINVDNIKSKRPRVGVYALLTCILVVGLYALAIASFGASTPGVAYGFAKLTGHSSLTSKLGSFDWVGIIFWLIYLLVVIGFSFASSSTLLELADVKLARPLSVAILAVADTIILTKLLKNLVEFQSFATGIWAFIISGCAFLIVFLITMIICKVKKDETESKEN